MNKAKEISALWSQIKPQIGEMVRLCHEVEDHAEVTADAYQRGYENGFIAGHLKAEKSGQSFYEDGYQRGLNDAWECTRKIYDISQEDRLEIFPEASTFVVADICDRYSASECIEKIRQYEQEKKMDGLRQNIQTIVDQCGYTLDEIAEVLAKMKETDNG